MSYETLREFITSNALSILAIVVSVGAFAVSLRAHWFQSRASLLVEVTGDWNFDHMIEKGDPDYGPEYQVTNRGVIGGVSVENHGGIKTTLKKIQLERKRIMQRHKTIVTLASNVEQEPALGSVRTVLGQAMRISMLEFSNIVIDPGGNLSLDISQSQLLQRLWKHELLGEHGTEVSYRLIVRHTFGKAASSEFRIRASKSTLDYLRVGLDNKRFYEISQLLKETSK